MANSLVSPGVQVTVLDESNYAPTAVGTVPLLVIATAQDKTNNSGTLAAGTAKSTAGTVYNIGDQRSLVSQFGMPTFPLTASGNIDYGSELAEYGLYGAYHVLDSISSAYVVRADVDLAQLEAKTTRPFAKAAGGTLWLDTSITQWGIFSWDAASQTFTNITPAFLYTADNIIGGLPNPNYGTIGSYAIVGTNLNNPLYYKNYLNAWVLVGSTAWQATGSATIVATNANVNNINPGDAITINTVSITTTASTQADLASKINLAAIPGVSADIDPKNKTLVIFATSAAKSNGATADGKVSISNVGGGGILSLFGISASYTYASPLVQFSKHSSVPQWKSINSTPRPSGSIWIKTTNFNYGANLSTYRRNTVTNSWVLVPNLVYANDYDAIYNLDPTNGGGSISQDSLYTQYDVNGDGTVSYRTYVRSATGATTVTGSQSPSTLTPGDAFTIQVSLVGTATPSDTVSIVVGDSINNVPTAATVSGVAQLIQAANLPNLSVGVTTAGSLTLSHAKGGVITLKNTVNYPLTVLGIDDTLMTVRSGNNIDLIVSNYSIPNAPAIVSQPTEPLAVPADGQLWFNSNTFDVDIMINGDGHSWSGYRTVTLDSRGYNLSNTDPMGPIITASKPTVNNGGNALNYGDLWIDTGKIDAYPAIYRWERINGTDQWSQIDTTDATTENGIVFADARWDITGTSDIFTDDIVPISEMLLDSYTDLDAPNPELYPIGCLLFNTRRSSNNVKKYVKNYFTVDNFPQLSLPSVTATWQSYSGKKWNNVPYFGRQAVRNVVVSALREAIDNNTALREEARNFNLLVCPGYPEVLDSLKMLNDDRKNTGFIIGEVPMGLSTDQTTVENYLIDAVGSGTNGEDGMVTTDAYTSVFYPGAAQMNSLDGVGSIVVPMSALMLRTFIKSDQTSELWFAPAGNSRGVVDAISIGYVDRANHNAFVKTGTPQGLRDLLYQNRVNPVTIFPQIGIINYGNHTRQADATALDRINVARLVAYLRGRLEQIVRPLVFEPNDKITRDKAKAICDQLLNDILGRRGVYDFLVVCDRSNNTNATIDRNELHIDIAIEPVKAVEFIYIPVRLKATGQIAQGNLAPSTPLA